MGTGMPPRAFDIAVITARARCAVGDSIAGRFASVSALRAAWICGCTCMVSSFLLLVLLRAAIHARLAEIELDDGSVFAYAALRIGVEHFRSRALEKRSEERRGGKEGVSTCRSRWWPDI